MSARSVQGKSRTTATRRTWIIYEEQCLLEGLKDIVKRGLKCDNGFKPGYLAALEQIMVNRFPGTDLKGDPDIYSKIHVWKKNYGSLSSMLARSGFGWNDSTNMLDICDDQVWEDYIKVNTLFRIQQLPVFTTVMCSSFYFLTRIYYFI